MAEPEGEEQKCGFLKLSAELRNQIYFLALDTDRILPIATGYGFERPDTECPRLQEPPLSGTCKQIRSEVLPIHYGQNIFESTKDLGDTLVFFSALGYARRKMLLSVRVSPISKKKAQAEHQLHHLLGPRYSGLRESVVRTPVQVTDLGKLVIELLTLDELRLLGENRDGTALKRA